MYRDRKLLSSFWDQPLNLANTRHGKSIQLKKFYAVCLQARGWPHRHDNSFLSLYFSCPWRKFKQTTFNSSSRIYSYQFIFIKKLIQNFITEILSQKLSYSWKRNNTYCILELILFGPVVKLNCDSDCGVGDFIKFGALLHWLIFFGGICSSLQLFANFSWWLRRKEMHQWDWSSSRKT